MIDYTPYVYLIGWSHENRWYIGARWAKDCHPGDLFKSYFTSSKHVKRFVNMHGMPDVIQIRKIFKDTQTVRMYEEKLLRRLNVIKSEKWLNKNVNGRFLKEGPQSVEHISKRMKSSKKTRSSKEYIVSSETRLKLSMAKKGKIITFSDEHKKNLKCHDNNKKTIECPHCNKIGQYTNMKRWHFDKCEKINIRELKIIECHVCGHTGSKSPNFYRYHGDNCRYVHSPK